MIVALVLGIIGFVFYLIKNSEANQIAQEVLRKDPAVYEAIGEVQDIGWPIGSVSTSGGGTGQASFSMSVEGSKGKGKYFATLAKVNGIWRMTSGRMQLPDGRSIPVGAAVSPPVPELPDARPAPPASGGRQLQVNASGLSEWRTVAWPEEGISFRVPADWEQIGLTRREVEFRPADRSAYFIGNIVYFDKKIPFESLWESLLQKGSGQLQREEIAGYALKKLGPVQGYLEISQRGDGATMGFWSGYVDTPDFGTKSVTLLVGSGDAANFSRHEGVLGAILESVQFR